MINDKIISMIKEIQPYIDFTETTNLLNEILDSVSLMVLVNDLESEYEIEIDMEEIEPDNFMFLQNIVDLVEQKRRGEG